MNLARCFLPPIVALGVASGLLVGCSPPPKPTPTPTAAFASEEEAFAAAEEVYGLYNDAGNARRDGADTPDPQSFLIGSALEGDIDAHNLLQQRGLAVDGHVRIEFFEGIDATLTSEANEITAIVCLDASQTRVIDGAGADVTPSDRELRVAQEVVFIAVDGALRISHEQSSRASSC